MCQVPSDTADPIYDSSGLRLPLTPAGLTELLNRYVSRYFQTLSHGEYRPTFAAGSSYVMGATDTHQTCVDHALAASANDSTVVLAVATAEHRADASGGFGTPGSGCATNPCPAKVTRRSAYVGASDFHPAWGREPAVDLTEHEIGHTLGWPHSGEGSEQYDSGLDVMSDSAAPRERDPAARDGQDTLGVNRIAAGWLPDTDVLVGTAGPDPQRFDLRPSTGRTGARVLVLAVDQWRFLTVEYLTPTGLDRSLPSSGVTVTLIDQSPSVCAPRPASGCVVEEREQRTLVGTAPFYDLLSSKSQPWQGTGWSVRVLAMGATIATVEVDIS